MMYSVSEVLAKLPIEMTELALRRRAKKLGYYHEVNRKIFFTEEDLLNLIGSMKGRPTCSKSSQGAREVSTKSRDSSKDGQGGAYERVLERLTS